jgi:F-type H+-transporting ATPase subunit delta
MKKTKQLIQLTKKMAADSFKGGNLQESKVKSYTSQIKNFELPQAILILSEYLKEIKRLKDLATLQIESATPLSPSEIKKIKNEFSSPQQPIMETKVVINPEIMGGIKVRLGNMIYDDTISAKIAQVGGAIANG